MAEAVAASNEDESRSREERSPAEVRTNPRSTAEYRAAFARFLRGGASLLATEEFRVLQAGADPDGGYLVAPEQFVTELIKAVDDQVSIRSLARTF